MEFLPKPTSKEELENVHSQVMKWKLSFARAGAMYWVSDNSIRKRFKKAWLEKISLQKKWKIVKCSMCWKEKYVEHNLLSNSNWKPKKMFYCNIQCKNKHQSIIFKKK